MLFRSKGAKSSKVKAKAPKLTCCASKKKCGRCPLRMLKDGSLPCGYTVKHRKLVRVDGRKFSKKDLVKAA